MHGSLFKLGLLAGVACPARISSEYILLVIFKQDVQIWHKSKTKYGSKLFTPTRLTQTRQVLSDERPSAGAGTLLLLCYRSSVPNARG